MKYALKRLITGLGVGREAARPCYSLALAQVRRQSVWQGHSLAGQRVESKGRGHRSCWVRRNPRGFRGDAGIITWVGGSAETWPIYNKVQAGGRVEHVFFLIYVLSATRVSTTVTESGEL